MGKKVKYRISAPRFLVIVAVLILLVALIIILTAKNAGTRDNGALDIPETTEGLVSPEPSSSVIATATPTPSPTPTPTPTPTIPPTAVPTEKPTAVPVITPSPTPGLVKDPNALSKPTKAMKKNAATGVLTGSDVNLRQGPSTSTPIVASALKKNAELTVYTLSGDFYFVQVNNLNKYGYIAKRYVKLTSEFGAPTPTPTAKAAGTAPAGTTMGTVTASKIALRAEADTDSKCIAEYKQGQKVYVVKKVGDFYYVQIPNTKKVGYMYAKYIKLSK